MYFGRWLRNAGFAIQSHKTYLGEDRHPLSEHQMQLYRTVLRYWASLVEDALEIPDTEKAVWRRKIADVDSEEHIIHDPDFYFRRPYALIRASVPA